MLTALSRQTLVVGLTGPLGSGVTTVSNILKEKFTFARVSLSDAIKIQLDERQKGPDPPTIDSPQDRRRALQDIGDEGRQVNSACWLDRAIPGFQVSVDTVIDSIRNPGEIEAIRDHFTNSFVIAVVASTETRWKRVQRIYDQDQKLFERDDQRDSGVDGPPHGQQVQKCVDLADYVFVNEADHGGAAARGVALCTGLETDIGLVRKTKTRGAFQGEAHMASAYAQSHISRCLKRHVGAVIVDTHGRAISTGYNENPVGMQPCERQWGYCFKDNNMEEKLEQLTDVYCPKCGEKHDKLTRPYKCDKCRENLKVRLFPSRNIEVCTAIHAEEQAINSLHGRSAKDATLYVTTFPCLQCARRIVDVGIKQVVYVEAYPIKESQHFLNLNGVTVNPFQGFKARYFNLIFGQVE